MQTQKIQPVTWLLILNLSSSATVKDMDVISFPTDVKQVEFTCFCGWVGTELELDILTLSTTNMICCPLCHNDDVRVNNDDEGI